MELLIIIGVTVYITYLILKFNICNHDWEMLEGTDDNPLEVSEWITEGCGKATHLHWKGYGISKTCKTCKKQDLSDLRKELYQPIHKLNTFN